MSKILDLKGIKIGKITIIEYAYSKNNHRWWRCVCECGNEIYVGSQNLIRGFPKSCGCFNKHNLEGKRFGKITVIERTTQRKHGSVVYKCLCDCGKAIYKTNGSILSNTNEYGCGCFNPKIKYDKKDKKLLSIWNGMKIRCSYTKGKNYKIYCGRGIKVCDEWLGENGFNNFKNWALKNGYENGLSIERINVNGNYCPENCTWIPLKEQAKNTRRTRRITINNETKCLADWLKIYKINASTFYGRKKKYNIDDATALSMPKIKERKFAEFGEFLADADKENSDSN